MRSTIETLISNSADAVLENVSARRLQSSELSSDVTQEVNEAFATFLDYLIVEMELLSDHLYFKVFKDLLLQVWKAVVNEFHMLLTNEGKRKNNEQKSMAIILNFVLKEHLFGFFDTSGEGLEEGLLKDEATELLSSLKRLCP